MKGLAELDALSIEINPLVRTPEGQFLALDAKVELDEAAMFRHPEWKTFSFLSRWGEVRGPREQAYVELLNEYEGKMVPLGKYVELDGDIAMILAGGGASLVAMDALVQASGKPGNYLEIAGNPDPVFLKKAASIVLSRPGIRAVWIAGSFANFTDMEKTIAAVLEAIEASGKYIPVVIRRDGPGMRVAKQVAQAWGERTGIPLMCDGSEITLRDSADRLMQFIK